MLYEIFNDKREFVLSTPALDSAERLHLKIPFASEKLDELYRMKWKPIPFESVREVVEVDDLNVGTLKSLLTTSPPPVSDPTFEGKGFRWRFFGHACVLLETRGLAILLDPVISYSFPGHTPRYTFHDLPDKIDYVLITHAHQDHMMLETLLQIRHRVKQIIVPRSNGGTLQDPSLRLILNFTGFKNVTDAQELDRFEFDGGFIQCIPFMGEHGDLDVLSKMTYLIKCNDHSVLFLADTKNIEPRLYEHIRRIIGTVNTVFVGMECDGAPFDWLYGPLLADVHGRKHRDMCATRTLSGSNCEQVTGLIEVLGCQEVYIYALGEEPWLEFLLELKYDQTSLPMVELNKLMALCRDRDIPIERLSGRREVRYLA